MKLSLFSHKKLDPSRGILRRLGKDPRVDWAIIVILGLVLAGTLVSRDLFAYFTLDTDVASSRTDIQASSTSRLIDVSQLENTLKLFDDRSLERATLLRSYTAQADPSVGPGMTDVSNVLRPTPGTAKPAAQTPAPAPLKASIE